MSLLYPQHCVSLSPEFVEPSMTDVYSNRHYMLKSEFEFYAGTLPGEFVRISEKPTNKMLLQPSIACLLIDSTGTFQPPDEVLQTSLDLYTANSQCKLKFRKRFDSFQWPAASGCSLLVEDSIKTIYTKHPLTGEVEVHKHPFPQLPLFNIVGKAHPALLAHQSLRFRIHNYDRTPGDILNKIKYMRLDNAIHPGFRRDWSWYWAKKGKASASAGVKRKALGDANVDQKRRCKSSSKDKLVHTREEVAPLPASPQRKRVRRPVHDIRPTKKLPTRSRCPPLSG
ncbi:hypothetical protein CYLTODRAFT_426571 [Cylindrobasidium torrendii FP15055 ss-10]|uniref:Uncharacterized protein n=1 Tax=Cylindrobasidium torrendii FP15055 ss-10 TaxID=1314674 RepID=A0A0D7AYA2_9AGAR|nr:hypothetical protein CYLTODRAFT_426571 [Cylindrobasidium torrendii FP15055 ss-10]